MTGARHRHRKPRRRPQWPAWLRSLARHRQATPRRRTVDMEIARHDAHMARVGRHEPSPLTAVQVEVDALTAVLAAATGPLPAAMQAAADDPRYPHLRGGQYEDDTHAFSRYIEGEQ